MTSITDNKGHKLTFTYEGDTGRVNSVSETMGNVSGETVSFTRTHVLKEHQVQTVFMAIQMIY